MLGLLVAELGIGALWLLGTFLVAPLTLRYLDPAERARRLGVFNATVLSRLLLMLYLVYPGVSVVIFSMFSCTTLPQSGVSYLDADFNIQCYTPVHRAYIGAAIFWLFAVTLGIPAFFIWLLYHFHVPHMARILTNNAFLKEAVQLAWQERLPQPDVNVHELTVDNIATEHLEALCTFLVFGKSADEAADILAGRAPFVMADAKEQDADEEPRQPQGRLGRLRRAAARVISFAEHAAVAALERADSLVRVASARLSVSSAATRGLSSSQLAEVERRNAVLAVLLKWCKTHGELSISDLQWEEEEDEKEDKSSGKEAPHDEKAAAGETDIIAAAAAAARGDVLSRDIPAMQARALHDCGFLFAQYRVACWCVAAQPSGSARTCEGCQPGLRKHRRMQRTDPRRPAGIGKRSSCSESCC